MTAMKPALDLFIDANIVFIDAVANRYRVTYDYDEPDAHGNYTVTHTSAVFAFDPQGDAHFMIRDSDTLESIVADLNKLISKG